MKALAGKGRMPEMQAAKEQGGRNLAAAVGSFGNSEVIEVCVLQD